MVIIAILIDAPGEVGRIAAPCLDDEACLATGRRAVGPARHPLSPSCPHRVNLSPSTEGGVDITAIHLCLPALLANEVVYEGCRIG